MAPKSVASSDVIAEAVHLACRAPSIHNSQPWRFVGEEGGALHLFVDRNRLVDTDFSGRQAVLSCGVVLDHLRVAMAAAGWMADVDYYPNSGDHSHVASIDFVPMSLVTDAHRRRANAILRRRSDHSLFTAPTGWDNFEPVLRRAVADDLAFLDILQRDARAQLDHASRLIEVACSNDPSVIAAIACWTGCFDTCDRIAVAHHRRPCTQAGGDMSRVVVLSALHDTRTDIVTCGEALSIALLEATMVGLATCPLSHMTELAAGSDIVSGLTGRALPEVLIRMGGVSTLDTTPPPTPRRPLRDVLTWQPSVARTRR